jgi:hypothetical protein
MRRVRHPCRGARAAPLDPGHPAGTNVKLGDAGVWVTIVGGPDLHRRYHPPLIANTEKLISCRMTASGG